MGQHLWVPLRDAAWTSWGGFWLDRVLNASDNRYIVCFFLPLVPILLLFPRRHLRLGIVLTSIVFQVYVFGAWFVPCWLLICAGYFWLSERYARDLQRADRLWWSPTAAVIVILGLAFMLALRLKTIPIVSGLNFWLYQHTPWLFPLGSRPFAWEAFSSFFGRDIPSNPPALWRAVFLRPHTCGLALLTARMLQYYSEIGRGTIPREQRTFLRFLAFVSFAPTMVMGPIERFKEFEQGLDSAHDRRRWSDMSMGLLRIAQGLLKQVARVVYLQPIPLLRDLEGKPVEAASYAVLFFAMHVVAIDLYLDFSGYCDVAIGLSRLVGYRATENFHAFWLGRSLIDMWRRWHITLSFILRDYVFMPLARRGWGVVSSLLITFVLCGALHNFDTYYLLWGVVMGLLVAVNQKWARWMRTLDRNPQRRLSAVRRAWLRLQPLPKLCAWALTINVFVLSGWICVGRLAGLAALWELVRRPGAWLVRSVGLA